MHAEPGRGARGYGVFVEPVGFRGLKIGRAA